MIRNTIAVRPVVRGVVRDYQVRPRHGSGAAGGLLDFSLPSQTMLLAALLDDLAVGPDFITPLLNAGTTLWPSFRATGATQVNDIADSNNVFGSVWDVLAVSYQGNTTAPDGTLSAQLISNTPGTTSRLRFNAPNPTVGAPNTLSYYLKAVTGNGLFALQNFNPGNPLSGSVLFDLVNGGYTCDNANWVCQSVALGGGWYRISVSLPAALVTTGDLLSTVFLGAYGPYAGTVTFAIWGAQREQAAQPGPLIQTASARTNVALYSTLFGTGWSSAGSANNVLPGAAAAPDGTVTATQVTLNSGGTNLRYNSAVPCTPAVSNVASMYLKALSGSLYQVVIVYGGSGSYRAWINLLTGAITGNATGGAYTNCSMSAVNAGNGWWRVAVAFTPSTDTTITLETYQASASGNYTSVAGDSFLCWGAQCELGLVPTAYIATAGSPVTVPATSQANVTFTRASTATDPLTGATVAVGTARVRPIRIGRTTVYAPLIEGARTNYFYNSTDFSSATWFNLVCDSVIPGKRDPFGGTAATTLVNSGGYAGIRNQRNEFSRGATLVFSVYVARTSTATPPGQISVFTTADSVNHVIDFSPSSGTFSVLNGTGGVEDVGNNYWRVWLSYASPATGFDTIALYPVSQNVPTLTGSVTVFGTQWEVGSFPSTYIPTAGSPVARAPDLCEWDVPQSVGQAYGTFFSVMSSTAPKDYIYSPFRNGDPTEITGLNATGGLFNVGGSSGSPMDLNFSGLSAPATAALTWTPSVVQGYKQGTPVQQSLFGSSTPVNRKYAIGLNSGLYWLFDYTTTIFTPSALNSSAVYSLHASTYVP